MSALKFTDSNFKAEVSTGLVLVDFWAEWCGPCRIIGPVIDELSGEYEGRVKIGKVDVDANNQTAQEFGVQSIPTLILFKDGQVVERVVGAEPKRSLENLLDKHLGVQS